MKIKYQDLLDAYKIISNKSLNRKIILSKVKVSEDNINVILFYNFDNDKKEAHTSINIPIKLYELENRGFNGVYIDCLFEFEDIDVKSNITEYITIELYTNGFPTIKGYNDKGKQVFNWVFSNNTSYNPKIDFELEDTSLHYWEFEKGIEYKSHIINSKILSKIKKSNWNVIKDGEFSIQKNTRYYTFIINNDLHIITANNVTLNNTKYELQNTISDKHKWKNVGFSIKSQLFDHVICKSDSVHIWFYDSKTVQFECHYLGIVVQLKSYCIEGNLFINENNEWKSLYDMKQNEDDSVRRFDFKLIERMVDYKDMTHTTIPLSIIKSIVDDIEKTYTKEQLKYYNNYDGKSDIPRMRISQSDSGKLQINYFIDILQQGNTFETKELSFGKYNIKFICPGYIVFIVNYLYKILQYIITQKQDLIVSFSVNSDYYDKFFNEYFYSKPVGFKTIDGKNEFVIMSNIKNIKYSY